MGRTPRAVIASRGGGPKRGVPSAIDAHRGGATLLDDAAGGVRHPSKLPVRVLLGASCPEFGLDPVLARVMADVRARARRAGTCVQSRARRMGASLPSAGVASVHSARRAAGRRVLAEQRPATRAAPRGPVEGSGVPGSAPQRPMERTTRTVRGRDPLDDRRR